MLPAKYKRQKTDAGRLFEVTTAFQIEDSSAHLLKNGRTLFSCCMNTCRKPFPPVVHFRANAAQGHSGHCPIEHGEVPV